MAQISSGMQSAEMQLWEDADSYDRLLGSLDVETKIRLVGVPFAITTATFRDGIADRDYCSLEICTADSARYNTAKIIRRRASQTKDLTVAQVAELGYDQDDYAEPLSRLVFNDSSTGVRRQMVSYLNMKHYVLSDREVTDRDHDVLGGELGQNIFDVAASEWVEGADLAKEGIKLAPPLLCMQGLRVSAYEYEGRAAATFYLG